MLYKQGDIFFANLGSDNNNKFQLNGIRPIVIIQNDVANKYSPTTIVAPITSQTNIANIPTRVFISQECGLKKDGVILLEQIRVIDKKILVEKVGHLNNSIMEKVKRAFNNATANSSENMTLDEDRSKTSYQLQYKDIYSSIKDIKSIKEMLVTSNYIRNKVKDWTFSGQ